MMTDTEYRRALQLIEADWREGEYLIQAEYRKAIRENHEQRQAAIAALDKLRVSNDV